MKTTYMAKPNELEKKWFLVDADGKTLGRLATEIAAILKGKHKPTYTPHVDTGDFVVVVNCEKIRLTGKKLQNKIYYRHTGHPGGIKAVNYKTFLEKTPERVIFKAVKGMLPHNKLGRQMIKKLKVYKGNEHPHSAQKPEKLEINA